MEGDRGPKKHCEKVVFCSNFPLSIKTQAKDDSSRFLAQRKHQIEELSV